MKYFPHKCSYSFLLWQKKITIGHFCSKTMHIKGKKCTPKMYVREECLFVCLFNVVLTPHASGLTSRRCTG